MLVEIDAATAVFPARPEQDIDVFAGGQLLATWHFSVTENRAQRMVRVPAAAVTSEDAGFPLLRLEFRPRSVEPIIELDPARNDLRPLGLALFGIRRAG